MANDAQGWDELIAKLGAAHGDLVAVEATGGYERGLVCTVQGARLAVAARSIRSVIKQLDKQIAALDGGVDDHMDRHFAKQRDLLVSVKGVGHVMILSMTADAVDAGGALLFVALAQPVQAHLPLLHRCLHRHKAHRGSRGGLADRGSIVGIVLATGALLAVGGGEARGDQPRIHPLYPGHLLGNIHAYPNDRRTCKFRHGLPLSHFRLTTRTSILVPRHRHWIGEVPSHSLEPTRTGMALAPQLKRCASFSGHGAYAS